MNQQALQYHLYKHPLYKYVDKDETTLRVAILGFGDESKKFLDLTLQNSQLLREVLIVHIFTESNADYDDYLAARPELKNFFTIKKISNPDDTYGYIFFDTSEPTSDDSLKEIVELKPHYVFIALNNESNNLNVALVCKEKFDSTSIEACISFPSDSDYDTIWEGLDPVFDNVEDVQLRNEIERQAFNVHLLWQKNLNVDFDSIRKEFLLEYNHNESISSVLGTKYKFHSWGIDLEDMDFATATQKFISLKSRSSMNLDFLYTEHRRWVTSLICRGFTHRKVDDCADGNTKDMINKNHVCLVHCREDRRLREFTHEDWDSRSIDELDDLDKISVKLHRLYTKQAADIVHGKIEIIYKLLADIHESIGGNPLDEEVIAFNDLKVCFEAMMLNSDAKQSLRYPGLSQNFRKKIKNIPLAIEKLNSFEQTYVKLIRLSLEYRDYKDFESSMFEYIPFVLTYTTKVKLVIPFSYDNNLTKLFANVAAATIINPEKIVYLALCKNRSDFERSEQVLSNVLAYMARKHLRASVEGLVFHCFEATDCEHSDERIKFQFRKVSCENPAPEIVADTKKFLQGQQEALDTFTALEYNDTPISNMLAGAGLYEIYRSYSFDSLRRQFSSVKDSEMFSHINTNFTFISPSEIVTLSGFRGWIQTQTIFSDADCQNFWDRYLLNTDCWKNLCKKLRAQLNQPNLEVFNLNISKDNDPKNTLELLNFFADNNYILILDMGSPGNISFKFANNNVKDLMKTEGRIFEIFVYHELRKHVKYFDEVILSFEPHLLQNDVDVKSELDIILTTGFSTVIVECKATRISPADYSRLKVLSEMLAINPLAVMVVENNVALPQKGFGDILGIKTISGKDVARVGEIICELLKQRIIPNK